MRLSLRIRVLLLVFLINALLFAAGGLYVHGARVREAEASEREFTASLVHTLQGTFRPGDEVHVVHILNWPSWHLIEDAILIDRNIAVPEGGGIEPKGVAINPVGRARRPLDFDLQGVLAVLGRTLQTGESVPDVEGGSTVPILGPRDVIWGGCWYRARPRLDRKALFLDVSGWFLLSTLLLTAGTFATLRRLVLAPVEQLAEGARRVRAGDLTVRMEAPRRRDELADLVRSFNAMTSRVRGFNETLAREVDEATEKARRAEAAAMTQRRLAAMGELAAGIAHEINNPLGGLENAVLRLESGELSGAKREEYLRLLKGGLERIGRTVSQLLRFTPRTMQAAAVDLAEMAGDAIDLVRHRADRLGVALELQVEEAGEPAVVRGARNELGQAVLNLLANALDAMEEHGSRDPRGPRIVVEVGHRRGGVSVEVRDNGPGVAAGELERVSDLFYTTKDVGKGSGLGLALVHNTVTGHGGRVAVSSVAGSGFTVELWFPPMEPGPRGEGSGGDGG